MALRAAGIGLAIALVEQGVELGVVDVAAVGALRRDERARQEVAQHVRLAHLGQLQDREIELARVQARDHRSQLEGDDLGLHAHVGQLLREEPRDVAPQALGRREDRQVQPGVAGRREERACGGRIEGQGRRVGVRPVRRRDEAPRGVSTPVEERPGDGGAVDGERQGRAHARVVQRRARLVHHGVGEVRPGARGDEEARLGGERRQQRRRHEVHHHVGASRLEAQRARVLVVHGAKLDRVGGPRQRAAVCGDRAADRRAPGGRPCRGRGRRARRRARAVRRPGPAAGWVARGP